MRKKCTLQLGILTAMLLIPLFAEARSFRVSQTPGGDYGCELCHTPQNGLNDFGFDSFDAQDEPGSGGNVDWAKLYEMDSDGDGYSNGLELGDPNGTWSIGDSTPSGDRSHPGDKMDTLCGSGSLEGPEECELGNLDGETCGSLGLGEGTLGCTDTCVFDTGGCNACGDGTVQVGAEECDGTDLQGATCEMMGFSGGTLSCDGCTLDTSGCTESMTDPKEGAEPLVPTTCGNKVIDPREYCDGLDIGGTTCTGLGFAGGALKCTDSCTFDTSGCTTADGQSGDTGEETGSGSGGSQTPDDDDTAAGGRACSVAEVRELPSSSLQWLVLSVFLVLGLLVRRRRL